MSDRERYTSRPPIYTDDKGLPRCGWCLNERVLCLWHRQQVKATLDGMKTTNLLGRAEADLRYVIRRPSLDKEDA